MPVATDDVAGDGAGREIYRSHRSLPSSSAATKRSDCWSTRLPPMHCPITTPFDVRHSWECYNGRPSGPQLTECDVEGHHDSKAHEKRHRRQVGVSAFLGLRDQFLNHDEDHRAGRECQRVWQDWSCGNDSKHAYESGNRFDRSGQLAKEKSAYS